VVALVKTLTSGTVVCFGAIGAEFTVGAVGATVTLVTIGATSSPGTREAHLTGHRILTRCHIQTIDTNVAGVAPDAISTPDTAIATGTVLTVAAAYTIVAAGAIVTIDISIFIRQHVSVCIHY